MRSGCQVSLGVILVVAALAPVWAQGDGFRIVEPAPGTTLAAGTTVRVAVAGPGLREVTLLGPGLSQTLAADGSGSFVFSYSIPASVDGTIELSAFGRDEQDRIVNTSSPMKVTLDPDRLEIDHLIVRPSPVSVRRGERQRLIVIATLADGGELEVTDARFGTRYEVPAGSVAAVEKDGTVSGLSIGEVDLTVRHRGAKQPATVRVVVSADPSGPQDR